MIDFPAGKMWAANIPVFALAVRSQNECALPSSHQYSHVAHRFLSLGFPETFETEHQPWRDIIFPYRVCRAESEDYCKSGRQLQAYLSGTIGQPLRSNTFRTNSFSLEICCNPHNPDAGRSRVMRRTSRQCGSPRLPTYVYCNQQYRMFMPELLNESRAQRRLRFAASSENHRTGGTQLIRRGGV